MAFQFFLECSEAIALGMESGSILDGQITASSMDDGFTPTYSRLNVPRGWGTKVNTQQWLEVDFKVNINLLILNVKK